MNHTELSMLNDSSSGSSSWSSDLLSDGESETNFLLLGIVTTSTLFVIYGLRRLCKEN